MRLRTNSRRRLDVGQEATKTFLLTHQHGWTATREAETTRVHERDQSKSVQPRDRREPRHETTGDRDQRPDGSTDKRQDRDEPGRRPRRDPGSATSPDGPDRTRFRSTKFDRPVTGPRQAQGRASQVSTKIRWVDNPVRVRHEDTATSGQCKSDTQNSRIRHTERVRTDRQGKTLVASYTGAQITSVPCYS